MGQPYMPKFREDMTVRDLRIRYLSVIDKSVYYRLTDEWQTRSQLECTSATLKRLVKIGLAEAKIFGVEIYYKVRRSV